MVLLHQPVRDQHHELFLKQRRHRQLLRVFGLIADAQVGCAIVQRIRDVPADGPLHQMEPDLGEELMKGGQQGRQHDGPPGHRDAHGQLALPEVLDVLDLPGVVVHRAQDLPGMLLQGPSRIGQGHGDAPVKQPDPVIFLQLGDVAAQGLLRDEQALGCRVKFSSSAAAAKHFRLVRLNMAVSSNQTVVYLLLILFDLLVLYKCSFSDTTPDRRAIQHGSSTLSESPRHPSGGIAGGPGLHRAHRPSPMPAPRRGSCWA